MEEKREKNILKEYAIQLAHQMDDEKRIHEEFLPPWKEEEIRAYGKYLRDDIFKKGLASQITTILHYAEEYKTLSWADYKDWVYV